MQLDILDKFTTHLRNTLSRSIDIAWEMRVEVIPPLYLLMGLVEQQGSIGSEILRKGKISPELIQPHLSPEEQASPEPHVSEDEEILFLWPEFSKDTKRVIERAAVLAMELQHQYVGTEHLLMALMERPDDSMNAVLEKQQVSNDSIKQQLLKIMNGSSRFTALQSLLPPNQQLVEGTPGQTAVHDHVQESETPALDFFGVDLTSTDQLERLDPVIGRTEEIDRVIHILSRRSKNNPVLIGDAGVGKTAIVEGLARRIVEGDVPDVLLGKRVVGLDLSMVIAGTMYRGEFESRLRQIIDEMRQHPDIILFIDEIHTLVGAGGVQGGTMDAANILKPALAKGDIRCIGATTADEYTKFIEQDAALDRRFQGIAVEEPTPAEAVAILKGIKTYYEEYHHVKITDAVIEEAVRLSVRYIPDQRLPDKALDVLDEAGAKARVQRIVPAAQKKLAEYTALLKQLQNKKEQAVRQERFQLAVDLKKKETLLNDRIRVQKKKVKPADSKATELTVDDIGAVIASSTGIPVDHIIATGPSRFGHIKKQVRGSIIGQDSAVDRVLAVMKRSSAGLSAPNRPLGSFLFLGPSGVGKTELARVLAQSLYGDRDALIRLDMSEFSESFTVSKLIGAPAGYVGHKEPVKLADQIRRRSHAVVLFDEIEKAHPDIFNVLLQILDEGHLTDAAGRELNFRNAVIIMTSNIGIDMLTKQAALGFDSSDEPVSGEMTHDEIESVIRSELKGYFQPEFLNRIDHSVVFAPLTEKEVEKIVDKEFTAVNERLAERSIRARLLPSARSFIARASFSPEHGARLVRKTVTERVENALADAIVDGTISSGDSVRVTLRDKKIAIVKDAKKTARKTTTRKKTTKKTVKKKVPA